MALADDDKAADHCAAAHRIRASRRTDEATATPPDKTAVGQYETSDD